MTYQPSHRLNSLFIAFTLTLCAIPSTMGEQSADAKSLLDDAKKSQIERKRAAVQKELDRLDEDLKRGQAALGDLEQNISKVGDAVIESKKATEQLAGRKKNVSQDLELLALRSEAEKLKTEGLNLLSAAHAKAKEAQTKRNEELEIKRAIVSAELSKTEDTQSGSENGRSKNTESSKTLSELRRSLANAESKAALASSRAREAMDAASKKLQQAEDAAAKVEKKQAEFASEKLAPATR